VVQEVEVDEVGKVSVMRGSNTANSIHVEVALEDALLEGIWLLGAGLWCLSGRCRHVRNRLGPIVTGTGCGHRNSTGHWGSLWRRGSVRDGGPGAGGNALGARSKLLGPVEALLV
jgi:hypothetical protein